MRSSVAESKGSTQWKRAVRPSSRSGMTGRARTLGGSDRSRDDAVAVVPPAAGRRRYALGRRPAPSWWYPTRGLRSRLAPAPSLEEEAALGEECAPPKGEL